MRDEEKILSPEFLEEIRRMREQRGISIEEVAEKTNIKESYIRAIEDGDLSRLPGGIYNRAFIRSVSEFLGVSTKPYERKVESDEMIKERQVKVELGRPQNASIPSKVTIIGCLFVIFFLYSLFYGPRTTKKEQVQDKIEVVHEKLIEKAETKIKKAKTPEEKEIIRSDLQARISDDAALMKTIPEISPIQKTTQDYVSKELVITLLAIDNVKIVVKDYYGKILANKEMTATEAIMLNGHDEYYLASDNIKNLEIYLDGVQIRDLSKIEKKGKTYIFKAEKLVDAAASQPFKKDRHAEVRASQQPVEVQQPEAIAEQAAPSSGNVIVKDNPQTQVNPSADKAQNNQQGSGR